ncbi:MAG: hypothetical protein BWY70_01077 [Bacteroidetes bacterium ADurb.Bin408]|nr:MAG: hypothetical protein BWY70_01077 [Bacteroidetes bacterium ADurb.Bin408]
MPSSATENKLKMKAKLKSRNIFFIITYYLTAMADISTRTFLGSPFTATVSRAG